MSGITNKDWADLEPERDDLAMRLAEAEAREQTLAAHVEQLTALLLELDDTMPVTPHMPMAKIKGEYLERVEAAIKESPETSLARVKAEWQAEALEEAADLYGHAWKDEFAEVIVDIMRKGRGYVYPEGLMERAAELRRQGEETP